VMADDKPNGNTGAGISLFGGTGAIVGGTSGVGRNVISNNGAGIEVRGATVARTVIRGNLIGTDTAGTQAQGNKTPGIWVSDASGVTIGGSTVGEKSGGRNVISANGREGILLEDAADVAILNNYIGVNTHGSVPLPNGSHGVLLSDTFEV